MKTPDVIVENCGTLFMVRPVSEDAKQWVRQHVHLESWQWHGNRFAVEHRYIEDIVGGMQLAGFTVEETTQE